MKNSYLILSGDNEPLRLLFAGSDEQRDLIVNSLFDYRISPVFPTLAEIEPPVWSRAFSIGFFAFDTAFTNIAQLLSETQQNADLQIWFSIGIYSVIVFASSPDEIARIRSEYENSIRGFESWVVDDGIVKKQEAWLASPRSFEQSKFLIQLPESINDQDTRYLTREISHGIKNLVPVAAQYLPSYLLVLEGLTAEVNDIISSLNDYFGDSNPDHAARNRAQIHTAIDRLVQINSVLAYAHSQAFGSAGGIRACRTFVHGHSLLGIGTAVIALHAFVGSVNQAFEAFPVYATVRESFSSTTPFDPFKSLRDTDLDQWTQQESKIDTILANRNVKATKTHPHILFYSGRLGFQESSYSISAAIQSIEFADSTRWSLTTLSHELMHSHVRMILASLMTGMEGDASISEAIYQKYQGFLQGKGGPQGVTESIQFALLNYCRYRQAMDQVKPNEQGSRQVEARVPLPDAKAMLELFRWYYRDINEIMVHLLDFRYFYDGDTELYIEYLWESWSTVPSVFTNTEHYILRSIAVIATKMNGSITRKIQQAIEYLIERIQQLLQREPENQLYKQTFEILSAKDRKTLLLLRSLANTYLAHVTLHSLYSSEINARLTSDSNLDYENERPVYRLPSGMFLSEPIQSPVSLLLDRVRHSASHEQHSDESDFTIQYRSAWLLVAAASWQGTQNVLGTA